MIGVDQEQALEILKSGVNLFVTGSAGSGKTYLVKKFAKESRMNVALTATTGIAALNLGGETFHRFLGIGIETRPERAERIIKKILRFKTSSKPWEKAKWNVLSNLDVLVIDEASMLRRDQFELIEILLSVVRDDPRPFGGVQVVLIGDFFQLPPVVTPTQEKTFPDLKNPYCFQSDIWKYGKFYSVNLTTNYRQSDKIFLQMLDNIRIGKITKDVEEIMESRVGVTLNTDIQPIKFFPFKKDVHSENNRCLSNIKEQKFVSSAEYSGKPMETEILKKETPAEDRLYFCKGAQVMMLTNDVNGTWVNGSMGIVKDINPVVIKLANGSVISPDTHTWERITYKLLGGKWSQEVTATMKQYPFKLAYSTTIHKSQGLTLDFVDLDISSCFVPGQAYVALSRVKTLDGLVLRGWNKETIIADQRVLDFYKV